MSHARQVQKAILKATARERKHAPRMKVSGTSVFNLKKLLRKQK
jgi:hypothetical protein